MLDQKAGVFGREAGAALPGGAIPVLWQETPFFNALAGFDPPGLWAPPFADPRAGGLRRRPPLALLVGGASVLDQLSRAGSDDPSDLGGDMSTAFSTSFQSRLPALLSGSASLVASQLSSQAGREACFRPAPTTQRAMALTSFLDRS